MPSPQRSEWAENWPLLLSAVAGIPVPVVMSAVLSQFMAPLEHEFGWSRAEMSIGYSLSMILGFICGPIIGRLVDKGNARLLAIPGIILTCIAMAAFSLATSSLLVWIGLWCAVSLVGALVGPSVWLSVVSTTFERKRSLAIAITICGMAVATMLAPISGRLLIDAWGWRTAWILLGLLWTAPALILTLLFFHDRRPVARAVGDGPKPATSRSALRQALLSGTFIRLALAVTVFGLAGASFSMHLFPALTDKGFDPRTAASVAGVLGAALIVGKLTTGSLFDRVGQVPVTLALMALLALASAILAQDSVSLPLAIAGCALLGLASGGFQVAVPCILSNLFDASIFGALYGTLTSMSVLAAAIGPLLVSRLHDIYGSYAGPFWSGTVIAALAAVLLTKLVPVHCEAELQGL